MTLYRGTKNKDLLKGGLSSDQLYGDRGNDFLDGGGGADRMYGGFGNDTYVVDHASDVVIESSRLNVTSYSGLYPLGQDIYGADLRGMSADARYAFYRTSAEGNNDQLWLKDLEIGSYDPIFPGLNAMQFSTTAFSADGRYLAVEVSTGFTGQPDFDPGVYRINLGTGVVQQVLEAKANQPLYSPTISANGRFIAYAERVSGVEQVMLKDMVLGTTELISKSLTGKAGVGNEWSSGDSGGEVQISDNGRYVAFQSSAVNLVPWDNYQGLFVKDRVSGHVTRLAYQAQGSDFDLSANGRKIAYISEHQACVIDLGKGTTRLLSVNADGKAFSRNDFYYPSIEISADGNYVLLYVEKLGPAADIAYISDVRTGVSRKIDHPGLSTGFPWGNASLSANGKYIIGYTEEGIVKIENPLLDIDTVRALTSHTLSANVENLILIGNATNGTGNSLSNELTGNARNNTLKGLSGSDTINGGSGNDRLEGGNGIDVLKGDSGKDTLLGGAGADILNGGSGNDVMIGGSGRDTASYAGASKGVSVSLAKTYAQNVGGSGTDTITLVENLEGSRFSDKLSGNAVDNFLYGGSGNDVVSGGAGSDTLSGGLGKDKLIGGSNADYFLFDSPLGAGNIDVITDYLAGSSDGWEPNDDRILLSSKIFKAFGVNPHPGADRDDYHLINRGMVRVNNSGKAQDANDFLIYERDTGKLFYDADGNGKGAAIQFAQIGTKVHPSFLNNEDFYFL